MATSGYARGRHGTVQQAEAQKYRRRHAEGMEWEQRVRQGEPAVFLHRHRHHGMPASARRVPAAAAGTLRRRRRRRQKAAQRRCHAINNTGSMGRIVASAVQRSRQFTFTTTMVRMPGQPAHAAQWGWRRTGSPPSLSTRMSAEIEKRQQARARQPRC